MWPAVDQETRQRFIGIDGDETSIQSCGDNVNAAVDQCRLKRRKVDGRCDGNSCPVGLQSVEEKLGDRSSQLVVVLIEVNDVIARFGPRRCIDLRSFAVRVTNVKLCARRGPVG
jgi:hypothetical protein